jgi:[ribosomal protein S18]-alanine N-acetyltransferase
MDFDPISVRNAKDNEQYIARKMEMADLEQVCSLEERLFTPPWSRQAFVSEVTENDYALPVVLLHDGQVISYMVVYMVLEEAHMANIAVAPEYQGHGLGKWMLQQAVHLADIHHCEMMYLEVRVSNYRAIDLYKKSGFIELGVRRRYYEDNEDALLMGLAL